jgi:phi13 family phage major tail protein
MNKVKYGLKNVHYAVLTEGTPDSYATPVRIPGAVNISLSPVGDTTTFVADDIEYFVSQGNNGYDGTLEIAVVPESFSTTVMGEVEDSKKVVFEKNSAQPKHFALLFEFTGDANQIKHVLYKCLATRANIEGAATTNKEVKTTVLNLTCRPNGAGYVKAKTKSDTDETVDGAWYTSVQAFVAGGGE